MAEFITTEHPSLKPIVRVGLLPAVAMSTVAVNTTMPDKIAIVGLLVLVSVALAVLATRQRSTVYLRAKLPISLECATGGGRSTQEGWANLV